MIDLGKLNPLQGNYASQFNYVSIDELTAFCAVQMQACDKQIREMTTQQQQIVQNGQHLGEAQNALNDLANAFGSKDKLDADSDSNDGTADDAALYNKVVATLNSLESAAAQTTNPAQAAIQHEIDELKKHLVCDSDGKPQKIASGDLLKQDVLDMAKDLQPTIDKNQTDQSMNMIKVQSAVSQREQMIQLVTGMIQKMNEMVSSVVANIGK